MSVFYHRINGALTEEPLDWADFSGEIVRDFSTRILGPKFPTTATFGGGSYRRLRDLFETNLCSIVDYEVNEKCGDTAYRILKAQIILADCEWNLSDCTVDVSLVDDSVGARITDNRKIPIRPPAAKTKNADPVIPCPVQDVEVYDPTDPLADYLTPTRRMLDWFDCITHAIAYITDSNVLVQSAWYSALPDDQRYAITTGYQLRTGDPSSEGLKITYNFEDLFFEIAKKHDLWIYLTRNSGGVPVVNIEPQDDLYSTGIVQTYSALKKVIQSIDTDRIWASVRVGSENGLPNWGAVESLPFLELNGHSEENYHFTGVCNTEAELDLLSKWNICTNLIESVLNGNTEHDDELFIIQWDQTTSRATKGTYYGSVYLYNEQLLNIHVLNRYPLPSNVGIYFGTGSLDFEAQSVTPNAYLSNNLQPLAGSNVGDPTYYYGPSNPAGEDFPVEISDPGNNYDPTLSRYTAPVQGYYYFEVDTTLQVVNFSPVGPFSQPPNVRLAYIFQRYDSLGNLLGQAVGWGSLRQGFVLATYQQTVGGGFVLDAGDYVTSTAYIELIKTNAFNGGFVQVRFGGTWKTAFTTAGGGLLTNVDPLLAKVVVYKTDTHMTAARWKAIIDDPRIALGISETTGNVRETFVSSISRTYSSGEASIETITDRYQAL